MIANTHIPSDTPETDETPHNPVILGVLARKLERERDEARKLAKEYRDAYAPDDYSSYLSFPWESGRNTPHVLTQEGALTRLHNEIAQTRAQKKNQ